jgi:hypothetical protein
VRFGVEAGEVARRSEEMAATPRIGGVAGPGAPRGAIRRLRVPVSMEGSVARTSLALIVLTGVLLSCAGCAVAGGAVVGHVLATHSRKGVGQDVNGSVYQSVAVVKDVLKDMQLPVTSEHERLFGVEISTKYQSQHVWIEVRDLSAEMSRINVRVKWPTGDTEDARRLLGVIMNRVSVPR